MQNTSQPIRVQVTDISDGYISANAMMAYVRITLRDYDGQQAKESKRLATLTLIYHGLWIAAGAGVASIAAYCGLNIYFAVVLGAIVSFGQEVTDKIKGTG